MRVYKGTFLIATVAAQMDLVEFVPAAEKPLELLRLEIGQLSEISDANEEQLDLKLKRMQGITSGTGGTTQGANNKVSVLATDTAAAFTLESNNTTKATATTVQEADGTAWNVRMGWLWVATPEERIVVAGTANGIVLELAKTPGDQIDGVRLSYSVAELA